MNKGYFIIGAVLLFSMILIPLSARTDNSYMLEKKATAKPANAAVSNATESRNDSGFRVKLSKQNKVEQVDLLEYLTGVTAAEMDADYDSEALKAQAIAAHTLALYRKNENKDKDYDITDDSSADQSYIDKAARKEKFGESFDKYEKKLQSAVGEVLNKTITYDKKPILAVYCDLSGGKTESAKNVWGGDYPYLQPVESVSDMLSPTYISTVTYSKDEFAAMASSLGITLSGDASKWAAAPSCSNSGTVLKIKLSGKETTGQKMRTAYNLRSANFDLDYSADKFIFTVRGYGHGVGMSQYGANYMAKGGSKYDEILKWYFTKCEISG